MSGHFDFPCSSEHNVQSSEVMPRLHPQRRSVFKILRENRLNIFCYRFLSLVVCLVLGITNRATAAYISDIEQEGLHYMFSWKWSGGFARIPVGFCKSSFLQDYAAVGRKLINALVSALFVSLISFEAWTHGWSYKEGDVCPHWGHHTQLASQPCQPRSAFFCTRCSEQVRWPASPWCDIISYAAVGLAHHCLSLGVACQPWNSLWLGWDAQQMGRI